MSRKISSLNLIKEVSKYSCLYDVTSLEYKDRATRLAAWALVAQALEIDEDVCQRKWRTIRDTYVKELREAACETKNPKKKYHLLPMLGFLKEPYEQQFPAHVHRLVADFDVKPVVGQGRKQKLVEIRPKVATEDEPVLKQRVVQIRPKLKVEGEAIHRPISNVESEAIHEPILIKIQQRLDEERPLPPPESEVRIGNSEFTSTQLYCLSLAANLDRLPPQKREWTKLQIHQFLIETEFGPGLNE